MLDYMLELQSFLGLSNDEAGIATVRRARKMTLIAEGTLPEINTSVRMTKGEIAHFETIGEWKHLRTRRKRVAGTRGGSIRIAKGIRIPISSSPGHTEEWQEFQLVDTGRILLTSKKLMFLGNKKNLSVPYKKIVEIEYFSDGAKINRGTQTPTYLFFEDGLEFAAILATLLDELEQD